MRKERSDALGFMREIVALIRADRDLEARERFNAEYQSRYREAGTGEEISELRLLLFMLDEYLNDSEAVRAGAVSKELIEDELHEVENGSRDRT